MVHGCMDCIRSAHDAQLTSFRGKNRYHKGVFLLGNRSDTICQNRISLYLLDMHCAFAFFLKKMTLFTAVVSRQSKIFLVSFLVDIEYFKFFVQTQHAQ